MTNEGKKHESAPDEPARDRLSDRYYHWLGTIYARLLDDEDRAIKRHSDEIIDETRHELADHDYHPDLVDKLRMEIAEAQSTLRHDREAFMKQWRDIEADLGIKLLSIADPTDVRLNTLREEAERKQPKAIQTRADHKADHPEK